MTLGGGFRFPQGVAVDGSGNAYVVDSDDYVSNNLSVKKIPLGCTSATCVTTLGGGFQYPSAVAVDGSGNVYVADIDNEAVYEMSANCTSANCVTNLGHIYNSFGVAVDGSGNVYVTDLGNNTVSEINRSTAPSLIFPATNVNATSAAQTVTITNDGNAALDFSAISYPANFLESTSATNDCKSTTSLSPSSYCTLTIDFSPLSVGALTGSLVLTDNSLNVAGATQSIALSGTGSSPLAQLLTPAPSSTLSSSTVKFTWNTGTGASAYKLILGTTLGGSDLYNSYTTTTTTETVKNLPTNSETIYATLYSEMGGVWSANAYVYTAK
jgi:hypothetical protein